MFGDAAWDFIIAIYDPHWDQLYILEGVLFRNKIVAQFNKGIKSTKSTHAPHAPKPSEGSAHAKVSKLPPPIPLRLSLEVLKKAREEKKRERLLGKSKDANKSFAQAARGKPEDLLKLQEAFLILSVKKIIEINNVGLGLKPNKPKLQITTKGPSRKNILIPMDTSDKGKILNSTNAHVSQINSLLKSYKSNINIDCI